MLAPLFSEVLGFFLEGTRTNLWGLRCPLHCTQFDLPAVGLTFLLGCLTGAALCFWLLVPGFLGSRASPSRVPSQVPESSPLRRAQRAEPERRIQPRLRGYLYE